MHTQLNYQLSLFVPDVPQNGIEVDLRFADSTALAKLIEIISQIAANDAPISVVIACTMDAHKSIELHSAQQIGDDITSFIEYKGCPPTLSVKLNGSKYYWKNVYSLLTKMIDSNIACHQYILDTGVAVVAVRLREDS